MSLKIQKEQLMKGKNISKCFDRNDQVKQKQKLRNNFELQKEQLMGKQYIESRNFMENCDQISTIFNILQINKEIEKQEKLEIQKKENEYKLKQEKIQREKEENEYKNLNVVELLNNIGNNYSQRYEIDENYFVDTN